MDKDRDENKDSYRKMNPRKVLAGVGAEKRKSLKLLAVRIGAIMHRQPDSIWTAREDEALADLIPIPEDSLAAVEGYYADLWPPDREKNFLRHGLATLLTNWPGEVDRARQHCAKQSTAKRGVDSLRAGIDPAAFLTFFRRKYPRLRADFSLHDATPDHLNEYQRETD